MLPDADCSAKRVYNAYANDDRVVRFFCPTRRYSDLLMLRVLKELAVRPANREGGAMLRARSAVDGFACHAGRAERYICAAEREFLLSETLKYCERERTATAYVFSADGDDYGILLEYGVKAALRSARPLRFGESVAVRVHTDGGRLSVSAP